MKNNRLKVLLLVLAMIFSTFASGLTFIDYEGNDSYSYKVDPPKSTTFYFDEDGEAVDGPTDYWVKFTKSGEELSFETNNLELELVSIKGGPNYRVYTDLDDSESGLTAPINPNNDQPYGISHYSFELAEIIPPPDPEGEIDITKIVMDEEEEILEDDETPFYFKVEVKIDDEWEEIEDSPFMVTGNGTKTISGLPMGEYRITEVDIDEDYESVSDEDIEVKLIEDGDEVKAEFTNMKKPETPPWEGSIRVYKSIPDVQAPNEMLEGFQFKLTGPYDYEETKSTDEYGEVDFTDLAEENYLLIELPTEGYTSSIPDGYEITLPDDIEEDSDNYAFVHVRNTPVPEDWEGIIRVEKAILGEEEPDLSGIEFTLVGIDYEETLETNSFGIVEFTELPEGVYTLFENVPNGYSSTIPEEGLEIELPEDANEDRVATINVNNRLIPEPELGEIEVEKIVRNRANNIMESNTRFYFILQLLVEDEWETIDDGSILGNGTLVFDDLEDGEYRVREVDIDNDFRLVTDNNIEVEINDGSSEEVEFTNRLRPPERDDDEEEEEEESEEEEEEVLDVVVIEEPVPEAPPVVEVVEEVLPLATLPKTGTFDTTLFGGLGVALIGLGLLLKRKE